MISKDILPENQRLTKDQLIRFETPWNYGDQSNPLRDQLVKYHKALEASEKEYKELKEKYDIYLEVLNK